MTMTIPPPVTFDPYESRTVTVPAPAVPTPTPTRLPTDEVYCGNVLSAATQARRGGFGAVCRTLIVLADNAPRCPFCGAAVS